MRWSPSSPCSCCRSINKVKQKPRPILTIQVGRGMINMERASSISGLLVQVLQKPSLGRVAVSAFYSDCNVSFVGKVLDSGIS